MGNVIGPVIYSKKMRRLGFRLVYELVHRKAREDRGSINKFILRAIRYNDSEEAFANLEDVLEGCYSAKRRKRLRVRVYKERRTEAFASLATTPRLKKSIKNDSNAAVKNTTERPIGINSIQDTALVYCYLPLLSLSLIFYLILDSLAEVPLCVSLSSCISGARIGLIKRLCQSIRRFHWS